MKFSPKKRQTGRKANLRQRITLTATSALLAVSIVLIGYAEIRSRSLAHQHKIVWLNAQVDLLHTMLTLYHERLGALAVQIAADPEVDSTFLKNAATLNIYQTLEIARAQLPERPVLVLFSAEGQLLTEPDRSAIPQNNFSQDKVTKIVIGKNDTLMLAHYAPARRGDKIIGRVGIFMPVSAGIKAFFPNALGLAFLDETGRLKKIAGELPDTTAVVRSNNKQLPRDMILTDTQTMRRLELTFLPLKENVSTVAGELVLIRDISATAQREEVLAKLALLAVMMIMALSLGLLMRALRHGFRPLNAVIRLLEIMTEGETGVTLRSAKGAREMEAVTADQEIGTLLDAVERFRASFQARNALISIQEQLASAKRIQQSLLPLDFNLHPSLGFHGVMRPAQEVGGDFFDIFQLKNGQVAVLIADVSGKGIAAALFAAQVSALLRAQCLQSNDPVEVIEQANTALCDRNPEDMFVSLILAMVAPETGHVSFVNAGHCPPMIVKYDDEIHLVETDPEPVLGAMPGLSWTQHDLILSPGDRLLLYSDGFDEARANDDTLLGLDAAMTMFADACKQHRGMSGEGLSKSLFDKLDKFTAGAPQSDDITLITLFLLRN